MGTQMDKPLPYWTCTYTKDQLEPMLREWNCSEPLPRKGQMVYIALPIRETIEIHRYEKQSTYGKPLYRVEMRRY